MKLFLSNLSVITLLFFNVILGAKETPYWIEQNVHFEGIYHNLDEVDHEPRVIEKSDPIFPEELKGKEGKVELFYLIDENGIPQQIQCKGMSHKLFGDSAVRSITNRRYQPAIKDGEPVKVLKNEIIVFWELEKAKQDLNNQIYKVEKDVKLKGDYFKTSEVDIKPTLIHRGRLSYPRELRIKGEEGTAIVYFIIDEEGKTQQVQYRKATHRMFGVKAVVYVQGFQFKPAVKNGERVKVLGKTAVRFKIGDRTKEANRIK